MPVLINKPANNNKISEYPNSFRRQNAVPLEYYEIFDTFDNAQAYAKTNPVAYVGQRVLVATGTTIDIYCIQDTSGTLKRIAFYSEVEDEKTRAEEAESVLDGRITSIANDYLTSTHQVALNTKIETETNRAQQKETALESRIDGIANDYLTSSDKTDLNRDILKLKSDIGNISNIMNFRGVVSKRSNFANDIKTIADPNMGDVVIYGEAEYVYDGSQWIEFGDTSGNASAIAQLTTDLNTEIQRAEAAELALQKKLMWNDFLS